MSEIKDEVNYRTKKQELMAIPEDKYSQPDLLKKQQKKRRNKLLTLGIVFLVFTVIFLILFILFSINILESTHIDFRINNLLILITTVIFVVFLCLTVLFFVKLIYFKKYIQDKDLSKYKSYAI